MRFFESYAGNFFLKHSSLQIQMALKVSLLFVIALGAIAFTAISYMEGEFKQSIANQQYALAKTIAESLDDKILLVQNALVTAGAQVTPAILADSRRAQRFLNDKRPLQTMFTSKLLLFDGNGILIAGKPHDPGLSSLKIAFRDYYQKTVATRKPVISAPFQSRLADHQPVLALTVPLFDSKGKLIGILLGSLNLMGANFLSDLPKMKIGKTGYFYLITADGIIISHPDRSRILGSAVPIGRNSLFDKARKGFDGSGITVNSYGTSSLTSFRHLHSTDWIVGLNFPTAEAYAAVYNTKLYMVLGVAVGTLVVLVFVWLLMKRLTLPILAITQQVESMDPVAALVPLVATDSSYEIDTLTAAFNRLVESVLLHQKDLKLANERLDQRVIERTADLELAIREQESFSYAVSHDLRAPLRHINSYLAILAEDFGDVLPPEANHFFDRTRTASQHMGKLIDDILELSRVSRANLAKETVDLSEVATHACDWLFETEPHRIVEVVISDDLRAQGDKSLLVQMMVNLLGNAWKYTSKNTSARIEFGNEFVADQEIFYIRDNGAGFDMAYSDKLFKEFHRLHGSEYEGNGIGLATVKRIIDRHSGRIWAESKLDEGTTFYFTLPRDVEWIEVKAAANPG